MKFILPIVFIVVAIFLLTYCKGKHTEISYNQSKWRNLHDGVTYVGMQQCASCHKGKHETFMHTGMGLSFDSATLHKTSAVFSKHSLIFDTLNQLYYYPFVHKDSIFVKEFKLDGKDTIHQRTEFISYIIGSGQHTNSHFTQTNGYIYQAPVTFYTQEKKWDLAPGFRSNNTRFSRVIESECMTCHNFYPTPVEGSFNKYTLIPKGIECERCHGPGSLHLKEKLAGILVDTSKGIDYSIVNPRHLSIAEQMDVCQRCHLQGIATLKKNKTFYDFKPGMSLSDVMNVFIPRYSDGDNRFIMASQADRLKQSKCYATQKISCITCHNPHISAKQTPIAQFNNPCMNCHSMQKGNFCSINDTERNRQKKGCVGCHMPRSGSIDIPHVTITDHNISKPLQQQNTEKIARFLGLENMVSNNTSALERAQGYLAYIEKYNGSVLLLDSVQYFLKQAETMNEQTFDEWINFYFLKQDYSSLTNIAKKKDIQAITNAWTLYRVGEAYDKLSELGEAEKYFAQSVIKMPLALDFQLKYGNNLLKQNKLEEARKTFQFIVSENPKMAEAQCNLGFCEMALGNMQNAQIHISKALQLTPVYEQAMMNQLAIYISMKQKHLAKPLLQRILKYYPNNDKAKLVHENIDKF